MTMTHAVHAVHAVSDTSLFSIDWSFARLLSRSRELKAEAVDQFFAGKLPNPVAMGAWVLERYADPQSPYPESLMSDFKAWIESLEMNGVVVHYTADDHDPYELDHLICQGCHRAWTSSCGCPSRAWEPIGQYTNLRLMSVHVNQGFIVVPGRFARNPHVGDAAGKFRAWHDLKHLALELSMDWLDELVLLRLTLERAPTSLHGIIRAVSYYNTVSEYGLGVAGPPRDTPAGNRKFIFDAPSWWL